MVGTEKLRGGYWKKQWKIPSYFKQRNPAGKNGYFSLKEEKKKKKSSPHAHTLAAYLFKKERQRDEGFDSKTRFRGVLNTTKFLV